MQYFRVKGKTAESGKARNRQYLAKSASQAQSQAEKDGIIVNSVEEIAVQPATERQLAYAADLGIVIPDGISKDEISDLISLSTSDDKPSTERHRAFAEGFGLEPTQYIGKKLLAATASGSALLVTYCGQVMASVGRRTSDILAN